MTIFLGCGFAAKYREGGGNFSVPLQWMLGLRRLKLDAIWLELLPGTKDLGADEARIEIFRGSCARMDWPVDIVCFIKSQHRTRMTCQACVASECRNALCSIDWPDRMRCSISAYSIHPPFLLQFERRIFCDLDPSEIFYWMTKMEMGQSYHHEFWTIGLNVHGHDCRMPKSSLRMENILSARGHETSPPSAASAPAQIHDDRTMVLGRRSGSGRHISRSFEKICVRALPRSSETDSRSAFRAGNEYQAGRSRAGASQQARLAPYRSSSGCAHTRPLSALYGWSTGRIHCHQRRGCCVADRLDKRSRCGLSCARPAGRYRRYRGGEISASQRADFVLFEALMRRKAQ